MRRFILFFVTLLWAGTMMAQKDGPKKIELTEEEQQMVQSNNDFAFRLFRQARKDANIILSPLGITIDLGMLNNGAAGQTLKEINEVLGFSVFGADGINQLCRKLMTEAPALDPETKVCMANNIYMNKGYELQTEFVDKANRWYDAQPETRDFADGVTRDVINQWGSDHTEGMIEEAIKEYEFDEDAVSYLLNALYFKGTWVNQFNPAKTQEEQFNGKKMVPMMHIDGKGDGESNLFGYLENDLYQVINLLYGSGAYQMTVFLPREGKTIDDVLEQLNGKNWQLKGGEAMVDLKLPRFETGTDIDLIPVMSALGMPSAFSSTDAEFPYFCNTDVYIGLMKQVSKIKVDEKGSEAAAVTVIGLDKSMPRQVEFHATRPFLYIISEQSSGVIFFIGQYTGNAPARSPAGIDDVVNRNERMAGEKVYNLNGQRLQTPPTHGLYIQDGRKVLR